MTLTEEQEGIIDYLRITLGDSGGSVFYPILTDQEYAIVLEREGWNLDRATKKIAFSILFYLTQTSYRERTSDIEVWNNASIEYRRALNDLLNDMSTGLHIIGSPWAAGIDAAELRRFRNDPNVVRSPLAQIGHCESWWTRVNDYNKIASFGNTFRGSYV